MVVDDAGDTLAAGVALRPGGVEVGAEEAVRGEVLAADAAAAGAVGVGAAQAGQGPVSPSLAWVAASVVGSIVVPELVGATVASLSPAPVGSVAPLGSVAGPVVAPGF
ncbi:hypothetical protein [Nannocystis pusilla]|uniref:hypothetical protein n=1 Tax=Nannocystis pusilla TaxID=889268 RepID=UPI003B77319E